MKAVVGHSSSMDTFSVYGHEIVGKRHRAARIVDGVFQSVFTQKMKNQNMKRVEKWVEQKIKNRQNHWFNSDKELIQPYYC